MTEAEASAGGRSGAPDGEPVLLERDALEKVRAVGGPALVRKLIDLCLEHAPERLASAQAAEAQGDLDAVERATHSLKSTAGNLGARRLQRLSEQAEILAEQGDAAALGPVLARLAAVYEETRQALIQEGEAFDS